MENSKETDPGESLENCKNAWMFTAQFCCSMHEPSIYVFVDFKISQK